MVSVTAFTRQSPLDGFISAKDEWGITITDHYNSMRINILNNTALTKLSSVYEISKSEEMRQINCVCTAWDDEEDCE